jgi:uncharacterized membrane protein
MQWYYAVNGQQCGPVEQDELATLAREGKLKPDDLVWNSTMGKQWAKASAIPGLFAGQPEGSAPAADTPPRLIDWTGSTQSQTRNRDLMASARDCLAGNWGIGVVTVIIFFAIQIVLGIIPVIGGVISFAISGALSLGWMMFFMGIARQESVTPGTIFQGFSRFGTAFLAALLMGLLVLAWMLPGLVLVIIAAVLGAKNTFHSASPAPAMLLALIPLAFLVVIPAILAQLRYSMTYFTVADDPEVGALDAIRRSKQMMDGNKWKFFCLQCRFIGWGLLCIPTLGIGLLWLVPYFWTSVARFYEDLRAGQQTG